MSNSTNTSAIININYISDEEMFLNDSRVAGATQIDKGKRIVLTPVEKEIRTFRVFRKALNIQATPYGGSDWRGYLDARYWADKRRAAQVAAGVTMDEVQTRRVLRERAHKIGLAYWPALYIFIFLLRKTLPTAEQLKTVKLPFRRSVGFTRTLRRNSPSTTSECSKTSSCKRRNFVYYVYLL